MESKDLSGAVIVNVGCGHDIRKNAINVDLYDARADVKADAKCLPMFTDGSVDVVIASQILEHFTFADGKEALTEWFRVLRPGGELIVNVPDMDAAASDWSKLPDELKAALMYFFYGVQVGPGQVHMSGYTPYSLTKAMNAAGFEVIWMDKNTPRRPTPTVRIVGRKPCLAS
jgi:ubiquinone/menaquinone biosynthesis C-methylase UbiE